VYISGNSALKLTKRSNNLRSLLFAFFLEQVLRKLAINWFHSSNVRQTHSHVDVLNYKYSLKIVLLLFTMMVSVSFFAKY
jgi:hypothetical protein